MTTKHRSFIELLCVSHPIQRQVLLNSASTEQIRCLCDCLQNVAYPVDKLRRFKGDVAGLIDSNKGSRVKKKILVKRGNGFLGVVLGPVLEFQITVKIQEPSHFRF